MAITPNTLRNEAFIQTDDNKRQETFSGIFERNDSTAP